MAHVIGQCTSTPGNAQRSAARHSFPPTHEQKLPILAPLSSNVLNLKGLSIHSGFALGNSLVNALGTTLGVTDGSILGALEGAHEGISGQSQSDGIHESHLLLHVAETPSSSHTSVLIRSHLFHLTVPSVSKNLKSIFESEHCSVPQVAHVIGQ